MASFDKLIESFKERKDGWEIFEHFSKWFLENDPFWSNQVKKVWLWDDWPGRWGPDSGIDLIFEHIDGTLWAVQSKFYNSDYSLKKADIDSFLSESSRKEIQHRLLLATTDKLGLRTSKTIRDQEKPVVFFGLESFRNSSVTYPDSYESLNRAAVKEPPKPRPYQQVAIDDVVKGFERADRGQLIMACGTGKTYTTLWIKEELSANLTLVLLPSLSLLAQTMNEWVGACRSGFRVLNVCSDESVGRRNDSAGLESFSYPVTSDVGVIRAFMAVTEPGVIFSTYHSSPLISQAQTASNISDFDLVIADEAHRCVGMSDSSFTTVLDNTAIRATKRLFTTATPRFYARQVVSRAKDKDIELLGMDNEEVFGKRFHTLTFGKAIELGLLTDYQVAIVGVDDVTVREFIEHRVNLDAGEVVQDAESLSTQIAIIKALKKYNLDRVITFHTRVASAQAFSEDLPKLMNTHDALINVDYSLWTDFVSGKQNAHQRRQKIDLLRELPDSDKGLLANARCLSEGVDVPTLDGIAFVDPKGSQVDIIQAVGRAIRLSDNKTKGTIIIPVFIASTEDYELVLNNSSFKTAWEVIKALRSHDEVLSDTLDKCRTELGKKGKRIDKSLGDKLIIDLPSTIPSKFFDAIETRLIESTTASWHFWFGLLQKYRYERGSCLVPMHCIYDGHPLGTWVVNTRARRDQLNELQLAKLNSLNFVWNSLDEKWQAGLVSLRRYKEEVGDCAVPKSYVDESGFGLGKWVARVRNQPHQLTNDKLREVNEIGFVWDVYQFLFEQGLRQYKKFIEHNDPNSIGKGFVDQDEFPLGNWVLSQRVQKKNGTLKEEKQKILNELGFIWNARDALWEKMFSELRRYVEESGDTLVPRNYVTATNLHLGQWVSNQRAKKNSMADSRTSRLNKLGFVWKVSSEK